MSFSSDDYWGVRPWLLIHHRDARELVAELEFVWDQIKNNSASSADSSPGRGGVEPRRFSAPRSGSEGPLKVLRPMSQDDEVEIEEERRRPGDGRAYDDDEDDEADKDKTKIKQWRQKVEAAMVKMTAEMAALREQIESGREWRGRQRRTITAWLSWLMWFLFRHFVLDAVLLVVLLIWMRRKRDRRLEDLVRDYLKMGRSYIRGLLPPR